MKGLHQENIRTLSAKTAIHDVRKEISEFRAEMRQEFAAMRSERQQEFASVRADISKLHLEMGKMKHDILKWMIGLLMAQSAMLISGFGIVLGYMDKLP